MLDVKNTFLKNPVVCRNGGGQDRYEANTTAPQQIPLQSNKTQLEADEHNKLTTLPLQSIPPQKAKNNFTVNTIPTPTTSSPNLDFLPSCSSHVFLIPEETHSFHEDPLLFSVEHDLLQPITSPFMVPGIYKKIDTLPAGSLSSPSAVAAAACEARNVYISEKEPHGRIVGANEFHELYVCAKDAAEMTGYLPKAKPRGVDHTTHSRTTNSNKETTNSIGDNSNEVDKPLDGLAKLAYEIFQISQQDQIVIDRKRNEIIRTENGSNQKTIYRYLTPEDLGLQPPTKDERITPSSVPNSEPVKLKFNLGRPRKRLADEKCNQPPRKTKVQQKRKEAEGKIDNKPPTPTTSAAAAADTPKPPEMRTRSGRIVRPVQPAPVAAALEADTVDDEPPEASAALMRNFLAELRDSDFRYHKPISPLTQSSPPPTEDTPPVPIATSSPTKRRVPPESICPTCKKIFLGRRLQRHFTQHPDHMRVGETATSHQPPLPPNPTNSNPHELETPLEEMTLFRFLTAKLQRSQLNEDQRADLFLHEINDLVTQLQLRTSLIRNTSGLHFVSSRAARVLGIPEGQYALDMTAIDAPPPEPDPMPETACLLNFSQHMHHSTAARPAPPSTVNTRSLDYTALSMSLDDTLTDEAAQKLNLSAGGKLLPPSEESLLRAVDDLVHEGMKKLAETNLLHPPEGSGGVSSGASVPHYDHVSDNAVEAVSMKETSVGQQATPLLDLAVDFFQFNNN